MTNRGTAFLAVATAVVVAAVPGTRAALGIDRRTPFVRHLRVFRPDGRPAEAAAVSVLVFRHGTRTGSPTAYVFRANADGIVTIAVPRNDPVLTREYREHLFDVEATIENGGPGVATRRRVVPYVLDTVGPSWSAGDELVRLEAQTS